MKSKTVYEPSWKRLSTWEELDDTSSDEEIEEEEEANLYLMADTT